MEAGVLTGIPDGKRALSPASPARIPLSLDGLQCRSLGRPQVPRERVAGARQVAASRRRRLR